MLNNPVMVEWEDICEPPINWVCKDDAIKKQAMPCRSVGFLVYRNSKKLIIAKDVSEDGDYNGLCVFPSGCIISVRPIK